MKPAAAEAIASLAETKATLLKGIELPSPGVLSLDAADGTPALQAALALDREPLYDEEAADDIQGNIIPGFNKDHQQFLFLRFGDIPAAHEWLLWLGPRLASMREVLGFRREFRAERLRLGVRQPPGMAATWTSVAFSYAGIRALAGNAEAAAFGEQSFRQGLAARSTYLGDPSDPALPGHRENWVVGGPDDEADALVIVAADASTDLQTAVDKTLANAAAHGISLMFSQRGDTLPGAMQGHEHFGFKDGVSQPGVRGAVSGASNDKITPRYLAEDDPHFTLFAKPGQPLVWPGQFLLGEPRQDPQDPLAAAEPANTFPAWARRGSYLVCRRLNQDVVAFWEFAASAAERLGIPPVQFASTLVGRWPSGAPLMRSPLADNPALAGDEFANNHFLFDDDTRPSVLKPILGYPGDAHAAAVGDVFGRICPHVAHIRKVNPRDSATDFGTAADTLMRLMLRRGIAYGEPIAGVADPSTELAEAERGLMFVAFMSSIEDQFEFVTRRWANSPVQPNLGGHDPIIGQRDKAGSRERSVEMPAPGGATTTVTLQQDFVTPTGGGYFFAPTISAITGMLAGVMS